MNDFSHLNNGEVLKLIKFRFSVLFPSMILKNQVNQINEFLGLCNQECPLLHNNLFQLHQSSKIKNILEIDIDIFCISEVDICRIVYIVYLIASSVFISYD